MTLYPLQINVIKYEIAGCGFSFFRTVANNTQSHKQKSNPDLKWPEMWISVSVMHQMLGFNYFLSSLRQMEQFVEVISLESQDSLFDYERVIRPSSFVLQDGDDFDCDFVDADLIPILKQSCSFSNISGPAMIRNYVAD